MEILRTPEERFASVPDFPFEPAYREVGDGGLRMAFVDAGPRDGAVVLLLHGEPTWSFLYRKMIPIFVRAGFRAVAPDLIGFGRSDKPARVVDYSYQRHVDWVRALVEGLDLRGITLFGQDWGSLIGLRLAAESEDRFARIVIGNGALPTGRQRMPIAFRLWRAFALHSPVFPVSRIVAAGCVTKLPAAARAAYDAPFPTSAHKAGARAFPALVPSRPDDPAAPANTAAWERLGAWRKPFLTLYGENDPILGHADRSLQRHVPGASGQPHERFRGGHFVQEDRGEHLANTMVRWIHGGA